MPDVALGRGGGLLRDAGSRRRASRNRQSAAAFASRRRQAQVARAGEDRTLAAGRQGRAAAARPAAAVAHEPRLRHRSAGALAYAAAGTPSRHGALLGDRGAHGAGECDHRRRARHGPQPTQMEEKLVGCSGAARLWLDATFSARMACRRRSIGGGGSRPIGAKRDRDGGPRGPAGEAAVSRTSTARAPIMQLARLSVYTDDRSWRRWSRRPIRGHLRAGDGPLGAGRGREATAAPSAASLDGRRRRRGFRAACASTIRSTRRR